MEKNSEKKKAKQEKKAREKRARTALAVLELIELEMPGTPVADILAMALHISEPGFNTAIMKTHTFSC